MKRDALQQLEAWKQRARRKPLIIEGARQVGKTWLVKEFAKTSFHDDFVCINFEEQTNMRNLFVTDFNITRILDSISATAHRPITPGKTLIFFDEIQEAVHGLTALKYFCENAPEYFVIAAGSLLGIELHKGDSFPVGKVNFMTLFPMSFSEFLNAMGEEPLWRFIENEDWISVNIFKDKLKDLLRQYLYVGGMPESVLEFLESRDWKSVREVQNEILKGYENDFSKHAPAEVVPRIRQIWNSVPAQLSRENRKFIFGLVKEGARAREYEVALQWLKNAGIIYTVFNVKAPRIPLKSYENSSAFKVFINDVGLLGAMSRLDASVIVNGNAIFTEFKGALTEQYVLQQLILKHTPYYYAKENSRLEIDFLIEKDATVYPVEVKAEENLKAKSLRQFSAEYNPPTAYRLSMSGYRKEEWLTNVPLFAAETL